MQSTWFRKLGGMKYLGRKGPRGKDRGGKDLVGKRHAGGKNGGEKTKVEKTGREMTEEEKTDGKRPEGKVPVTDKNNPVLVSESVSRQQKAPSRGHYHF